MHFVSSPTWDPSQPYHAVVIYREGKLPARSDDPIGEETTVSSPLAFNGTPGDVRYWWRQDGLVAADHIVTVEMDLMTEIFSIGQYVLLFSGPVTLLGCAGYWFILWRRERPRPVKVHATHAPSNDWLGTPMD